MLLLMQPRKALAFWAAEHIVSHIETFIKQHPQILLLRAALKPFSAHPGFELGIALTQVHNFFLVFLQLHKVGMGSLPKPDLGPLDGIPSL